MLNYLVALSYASGKLVFTAETNLNEIYFSLLKAVYERGYERNRNVTVHATIQGMKESDFIRILEEIALASWHGDGRTTTVKEIENHCDTSGLRRLLTIFEEGAQAGVTRLLAAFYFRQSGGIRDGERTFEFTHKSFGEYLTARRIVRCIARIHSKMNESDIDECWDAHQGLVHWAQICASPTAMSLYLFEFLKDEVRLQSPEDVAGWQQTLVQLVNRLMQAWMPMEELTPRGTFRNEAVRARHAEEALFAALYACACVTKQISNVSWQWPQAFGSLLSTLQGQRTSADNPVILLSLGYLNLSGCIFTFKDLYGANLKEANLSGADLNSANLRRANLKETNLKKADLRRSNLSGADLRRVDLSGASLRGANLRGADLSYANLKGAHLAYAKLSSANLRGANLERVDLSYADLSEANISDTHSIKASLNGANLSNANLSNANLSGSNLSVANLSVANLRGANLKAADLSVADLSVADLSGANLNEAKLSVANLCETDLIAATLRGANLRGANLREANLRGADLSDVYLSYANLSESNLGRTNLRRAHLSEANLMENQIQDSILCRTKLPDSFTTDPNRDC